MLDSGEHADTGQQNIAQTPERKLAELMYRELGMSVRGAVLRRFIVAHWSKVSMLAHQIHDAPDPYVFLQAGDG